MVDMSLRYQSLTGSFLIGYYLAFYLSCSQNSDLKHKGTLCSAFHLLLKSHFYLSVIGYMIGIHPKGTNRRSFFQCFPWKVSNKTKQKLWQKYVFLDFSLEFFFFEIRFHTNCIFFPEFLCCQDIFTGISNLQTQIFLTKILQKK